jgi:hypothetical protein
MRWLVLLAPFMLVACGGGATTTAVSGDPLVAAADATAKQSSENVTMQATIDLSGQSLTLDGSGAFAQKRGRLHVTFDLGALGSSGGDEVFQGNVVWLRSPLFIGFLHGKHWIRLELDKRANVAGFDLNDLTGQTPTSALAKLRLNGTVSAVGKEKVGGVDTTHYRKQVASGDYRTVEAWVDGGGLVRKLALDYDIHVNAGGTERAHTVLTMTFSDFGTAVLATPPAADDVIDASELVR